MVQNVATGAYQLIKTNSIHEPLATLGVSIVNGIAQQSMANDGSLPIGLSAFNPSAFDPAAQLSTINVLNTTMTYGPRGKLQTIVDTLAPTTPTANVMGGTLPNYFVTGGSQVTQFNTGDNPNWQSSWSSQFESVTTSYGSDHQILEQMFLCGSSNHYLVVDNVFDPLHRRVVGAIPNEPASRSECHIRDGERVHHGIQHGRQSELGLPRLGQ